MIEIDNYGNIRLELSCDGSIIKYLMPTGIKTYYCMTSHIKWADMVGHINGNGNFQITVKVE